MKDEKAIMDALNETPGYLTPERLARQLGMSTETIYKKLRNLESAGEIRLMTLEKLLAMGK
ncbi:MAG: HTH domain-containing protein [Candidatus Altiarchaeota archaeon]|nr:HTH domain-containing protein [Candidatus Altiarchaeota archaeon]